MPQSCRQVDQTQKFNKCLTQTLFKIQCFSFFFTQILKFIFNIQVGVLVIKKYVANRKNYGHQKMNLIIHVKRNEKSWIFKIIYGKPL